MIANNALQLGMGKNLTTALYSENTKPENIFDETKTAKNAKITKHAHAFKNHVNTYTFEILSSFNPELQLKVLNF